MKMERMVDREMSDRMASLSRGWKCHNKWVGLNCKGTNLCGESMQEPAGGPVPGGHLGRGCCGQDSGCTDHSQAPTREKTSARSTSAVTAAYEKLQLSSGYQSSRPTSINGHSSHRVATATDVHHTTLD